MRVRWWSVLQLAALVVLTFGASLFAADSIMIGGTSRSGVAGEVIRVPIVIDDNAGTPAGADQVDVGDRIRYIALKATFSNDALISLCGANATNCTFLEAGIAPAIIVQTVDVNDPCGRTTGTIQPCYFRSVPKTSAPNTVSYVVAFSSPLATSTTAPFGNLVGYLKLKMAAAGPVTISLDSAEAYLSGYDVYSNDGNPSSDETVANTNLTVSSFRPADANNDAAITAADLTKVMTDLQAAPNLAVTGTNFRSDCDVDGKLTGADVLCVFNELNPSLNAGSQKQLLDIDLDGNVDALTDGVLLIRALAGLTGAAVTNGTLAGGATRTDPTAIVNYVMSIAPAADVDMVLGTDALSDGLMITRAEAGLTGTTITNNAIGSGAGVRSTAQVEAYIATLQQVLP